MDPGTRLGLYEITGPLGAGGMGEVYRAHDSRLDRDVAIKVLPAELAEDPERLARLQQEARLLAALDHPNIAAVYGLEETGGTHFVVMQLAAGETVADRIACGAMPVSDVIEVAQQIAEGLESAHEAGVIHRDLKPANLMVAPSGEVKILDFGLAKAAGPASAASGNDMTASPTMMAMTSAGMIMGTAAYMSPEQARGKPLDRRTDIWSFGVVLYEMLTGAKAFDGETVTDVLAAIVTRDPDWDQLPESTPAGLVELLQRCLDRDPRQRLRDIGEARIALAAPDRLAAPATAPAAIASRATSSAGWAVAVLVGIVALPLGWMNWIDEGPNTRPRYVAVPPGDLRFAADHDESQIAVSPDGITVVVTGYVAGEQGVWVRSLEEPEGQRLEGVGGWEPAWSPNGSQIALAEGGRLVVHDLRTGSTSVRFTSLGLIEAPAWSEDGQLFFSETLDGRQWISLSMAEGEVQQAVDLGSSSSGAVVRLEVLSTDRFLISRWNSEHGHVHTSLADRGGSVGEPLLHLDAAAVLGRPDVLLFGRDGSLWAQRLDTETGSLGGDAVALIAQIDTSPGNTPWLSVGGNTLTYRTGVGAATPTILEVVDRQGDVLETLVGAANYYDPRLSPDGTAVVYDLSTSGDAGDLWIAALDGAGARLTSSPADETRPVFSPDGTRLVFETRRQEIPGTLFFRDVNNPVEQLIPVNADPRVDQPTDWVEGMIVGNGDDLSEIWLVDAETGASRPYRETNFVDYGGAIAPDGTHIAYVSNESGQAEVWVDTLPTPSARRMISTNGGTTPVWRRDGREIIYVDRVGNFVSVPVTSTDPLGLGQPVTLFSASIRKHGIRQFDITADGDRLLLNRLVDVPDLPVRLLIGWREVLAARAPADW